MPAPHPPPRLATRGLASARRRWQTANGPTGPRQSRAVALWVALLVLASCGVVALRYGGFLDLRVYLMGGTGARLGEKIYGLELDGVGLPFTYPPFAALLLAPLSVLPFEEARVLWALLSLLAFARTLWLVRRSLGPKSVDLTLLLPGRHGRG